MTVTAGVFPNLITSLALAAIALGAPAALSDANSEPGQPSQPVSLSVFLRGPDDLISITHGGQVGIARHPEGILDLADSPVQGTLALTARVRDTEGNIIGIASELEHFTTIPVEPGVPWHTYWTVVLPGRGSIYGHELEQLSEDILEAFSSALSEGRAWVGELTAQETVGPLSGHRGLIVGGTGEFEGVRGSFVEVNTLRRFTSEGVLYGTLNLRFTFE